MAYKCFDNCITDLFVTDNMFDNLSLELNTGP